LRVWGEGKHGLQVGADPEALPVRQGETVHLEARVSQPAYIYLLWESQGKVDPLYPWYRDFGKLPNAEAPVEQLHSPPEPEIPADAVQHLVKTIGKMGPSRLRNPKECAVLRLDAGQLTAFEAMSQNRGLAKEAAEIDEPLLELLERLHPYFEMIRAVRFAHQGD
jgi:hypothetical protein